MRNLLLLFVLVVPSFAGDPPCLIVKHAGIWVIPNWQYVEGDFPEGMKWKSNLTDRNIRQIKQKGGKVVIVPEKYSSIDLEDARKQCGVRQPTPK
jgi:predicted NUDIX family NTP pyrophosphohydrolase